MTQKDESHAYEWDPQIHMHTSVAEYAELIGFTMSVAMIPSE